MDYLDNMHVSTARPFNKTATKPKSEIMNNSSVSGVRSFFESAMLDLKGAMGLVRKESPVLFWIGILCFAMGVACLPGLAFDDRTLMGVNVWLKPLKFCISTAIYILTVGYMATLYPFSKWKKWSINGITAWTLLIELGIIFYQGARGVFSHYNFNSQFDGLLFAAMGILIGINVVIMVLFVIETIRLKMKTKKSVQWAILIGWVVVVLGSWVGGQMIAQMSHNIGVADGGAGIPFLNWSTIAGDLRVAHFFGIHGIQIIPLFALWLTRKFDFSHKNEILVITLFGLGYLLWLGMTFYQAKIGMSLIS